MFETRISVDRAPCATAPDSADPLRAMIDRLTDLAMATSATNPGLAPCLAARYMAAAPIACRRFDALLDEAETFGTAGRRLIAGRGDPTGPATEAAARFLGRSLDAALLRLDALLPAARS